jgi:hypothetical protein
MTFEETYHPDEGFSDEPVNLNHTDPNVVQKIWGKPAICFEGKGELGHEPFLLTSADVETDQEFSPCIGFCKTARKPYDMLVCATLILVNNIAPDLLDIRSDGGIEDWEPALRLARTFDKSTTLPKAIDPQAVCQPEAMSFKEIFTDPGDLQDIPVESWEIPKPSQFLESSTDSGLYF